jgi:lipoate---protein ligase
MSVLKSTKELLKTVKFGVDDVSDIEKLLTGVRYSKQEVEEALKGINVQTYFGNITKEEFIDLVY